MNKFEIKEELERIKIDATELSLRVECITDKMDNLIDALVEKYGDFDSIPAAERKLLQDYGTIIDRIGIML